MSKGVGLTCGARKGCVACKCWVFDTRCYSNPGYSGFQLRVSPTRRFRIEIRTFQKSNQTQFKFYLMMHMMT